MAADRLTRWRRAIEARAQLMGLRLAADVVDELLSHVGDVYDTLRAQGRSEADALAEADRLIATGAYDAVARRTRARRPDSALSDPARRFAWPGFGWAYDLRYALRGLVARPLVSLAVVLILGVGVGVTTAAFAIVRPVLLAALPYPAARELFVPTHGRSPQDGTAFSPADWRDYASRNHSLAGLAAYASWPVNLVGVAEPLRLRSVIVSGDFFSVLGTPAARGRLTGPSDDRAEAPAVAVLSDRGWRRLFGADPGVVGRIVHLNAQPVTVVGIMPPAFAWPDAQVDLWMPMALSAQTLADRSGEWLSLIGRVRSGVALETATSDLSVLAASLAAAYPAPTRRSSLDVVPVMTQVVGPARRPLALGALAALAVWLAAVANAGNLMLASVTLRREELAVRAALGASPSRLTRGLLLEGVLLAVAGSAVGAALAWLFLRGFEVLADGRVPRLGHLTLDPDAGAVAMLVALASATVVAAVAARRVGRAVRTGPTPAGARMTSGPSWAQCCFLGSQVAAALVLVSGAALVGEAYWATTRIDPGFDTTNLVSMQLTLPRARYHDSAAHAAFAERAVEALQTVAGVSGAAAISDLPFVGNAMHFSIARVGEASSHSMTVRLAGAGLFGVLKVPLLAGRVFGPEDRRTSAPVAILNQTAARPYGGSAMLGEQVSIAGEGLRTVVGIVGDIKHEGLQADEGPVLYAPFEQPGFEFVNWVGLVARLTGPLPSASTWRAALARVDPSQPVDAIEPMSAYLAHETGPYRFGSLVVGSLAATTLTLVLAGVASLSAFLVGRRARELALRVALGATGRTIVTLVVRPIALVFLTGAGLGWAVTAVTNAGLERLVGFTGSAGLATVATTTGLLACTVLVSAVVPALRGARLDPTLVLRGD
jgi:predicted permease